MVSVYIDGEAGTTGLLIRERLAVRLDVRLLAAPPERRKDPAERARLLGAADVAILCLPDTAAREAVALLGDRPTRLIDASSAHRTADGWVYGLPELAPGQADAIRSARRVANPGCFATGAIVLLRPLIDAGLLPPDHPIAIAGVGGYTAGGRGMIARRESGADNFPHALVGLGLDHRHLPEIRRHAGLAHAPVFTPAIAAFPRGMLVTVPLALRALPGRPTAADVHAALAARYPSGFGQVGVAPLGTADERHLDAAALAGCDDLEIRVLASADGDRAVLAARFDNLGKGAVGAALRNLDLMLGRI